MTNAQSTQQSIYGSDEWKLEQIQFISDTQPPARFSDDEVVHARIPLIVEGIEMTKIDVCIMFGRVFSEKTGAQCGWEIIGNNEKFLRLTMMGQNFDLRSA